MRKLHKPADSYRIPVAVNFGMVVAAMSELGIAIHPASQKADRGQASINGVPFLFALLPTAVIVRGVVKISDSSAAEDIFPHVSWLLACNKVNVSLNCGRASVVTVSDGYHIRAEVELPLATGLSRLQLRSGLRAAVDDIFNILEKIEAAQREATF
ncbi:hypothetical protein CMUST_08560 [Corynebacterium mustelae]|uniref:Bacterial sensory transduction regulator n=1 Tax=Corynebacterium mustelae TaxID=571915 RepID=A0A0G3GXZ1_9CORY|nr:hypothetical protein [Corynebacterium mustelae]AKK06036.1 hypothetical protein CMUST_08560 [Corynebacterium mustelae]